MTDGDRDIPLARPVLGEREEELVLEVLRSGQLSLGPMLTRFERDFATAIGAEDAVAVANGTTALHLAIRGLGWKRGDRVVTTPLSFVASSNALLFEGVEPLFADVDPVSLTIDPEAAAAAVDENTVGLLPVHIFGRAAAMPELEALAADRGLAVLEDACQALGAVCSDGRLAGARGNAATFAFYANKQLTTGEGGMLIPRDAAMAEQARSERNQGRSPASPMKVMAHDRLGFNYRLTDLQAALGVAQLERFETLLSERATVAAMYGERLRGIGGIEPGEGPADGLLLPAADLGSERRSWFVYLVRLPAAADREEVIAALDSAGIDARPYLPCIHLYPHYRERFGFEPGQFPVAEELSARALALPFFPGLGEVEVERVCSALAAAIGAV